MKIHLVALGAIEAYDALLHRAQYSTAHVLVDDPASADMIVVTGHLGLQPELLLQHPVYLAYPDKCAAYNELDHFVPLLPGVYCSAHKGLHSKVGRVFSFSYLSRNGPFPNLAVAHRPDAEKKFLFSFQGGSTCILRKRIFNLKFNRPDVLIENTSSYGHWSEVPAPDQAQRQRVYGETISASHFVLCPRGAGSSSIRLFEVMKAGVAPVLISDKYPLPPGIDWDNFLIRVRERDIRNLPQILEPYIASSRERGRLAREAYLANFTDELEFDRVMDLCAHSLRHGGPAESVFRSKQKSILAAEERRHMRYRIAKKTALGLMKLLHIKNPYQMNQQDEETETAQDSFTRKA